MLPHVSVTVVTTNDARHIPRCLASLFAQDYGSLEVIFVDNASTDGSRELLQQSGHPVQLICNDSNRGFCAAHNQAIRSARGDWILCLNPDTKLETNFVSELVRAGELHPSIGIVCPKIFRLQEGGQATNERRLDSTGMYITPLLRHHDRGSQQIDEGQYNQPEYVFGYTGAAVFFRRAMIEDISIDGEFMDEDFFFYREDGDLSWRAQLLGWRCLYTPWAVGYHVRRVFENNRSSLPPAINLHSTKNRFLMRIKNMTPGLYRKVFFPSTARDIAILAYVIGCERTSLPGLWFVLKNWQRFWQKRRCIQSRKRTSDAELHRWFQFTPVSVLLEPELRERLQMSSDSPTETVSLEAIARTVTPQLRETGFNPPR